MAPSRIEDILAQMVVFRVGAGARDEYESYRICLALGYHVGGSGWA